MEQAAYETNQIKDGPLEGVVGDLLNEPDIDGWKSDPQRIEPWRSHAALSSLPRVESDKKTIPPARRANPDPAKSIPGFLCPTGQQSRVCLHDVATR